MGRNCFGRVRLGATLSGTYEVSNTNTLGWGMGNRSPVKESPPLVVCPGGSRKFGDMIV